MSRWVAPFAVLVASAIIAHWAALAYAPSIIMDRALATLKDRGVAQHAFTTPKRISPQTQVVVRSSPDLFYSLCRYDLSAPGSVLEVKMAQWPDYQSLSFFDDNTNNFLTERGNGKWVMVRLAAPGNTGAGTIESPSARGVILIRRLAPTQDLYDKAAKVALGDACNLIEG